MDFKSDDETQPSQGKNVCVWCQGSLFKKRSYALPEGPASKMVSENISPRKIPEGAIICHACWLHVRRTLQKDGIINLSPVNIKCVCCGRSLGNTRRHPIPEGPEKNEILSRIHPREIPPGGLVCYACFISVRRSIQRAANIDERRTNSGPSYNHQGCSCASCGVSLFQRQTRLLSSGPERDAVAAKIHPSELPKYALVCTKCWAQLQEKLLVGLGYVLNKPPTAESTMTLDSFTHTANTSARCFVPGCTNPERKRVLDPMRKEILKTRKIYVTDSARVCNEHKSSNNWDFLDQDKFSNTFTKKEMDAMLQLGPG